MKITSKEPPHIREVPGLLPNTEVEWELREGAAVPSKGRGRAIIDQMRGRGTVRMSTDEIMALTRGEP